MKSSRIVSILLALLMVALMVSGCAAKTATPQATTAPTEEVVVPTETDVPVSEPVDDTASNSITVTDMTGREIVFDKPVEKIVALTASDCEILYAIGAGELIVGRGEYCNYPAEVLDITSVQSGYDTNIEQIIALAPDTVVMSTMAQTDEQVAALENAGIKVVVSDAQNIEGVYAAIELLGAMTAKDAESAALVESMKTSFAEISAKVEGESGKTVYFEVSPLEYGLWTAGADTFMDEIAAMLGLTNAFADVSGWAEISEEQVIERNPDYIVTISMYYGEGSTPVEEILSRAGWENLTAITNAAVFNANSDELSRPAPRLVDGCNALYDFVYGNNAA